MNQMTKKLFIITTRILNSKDGGFLNDKNCKHSEWDAYSPMLDFYMSEEDMVAWVYSVYTDLEDLYSEELKKELREFINISSDPLENMEEFLEGVNDFIQEKKEEIMRKYREELYAFVRDQLTQTIEGVKQTSYFAVACDDKKVIALPHLANTKNQSNDDNKKWINTLIDSFAEEDEEVFLVLHDKDLYGYLGITFKLLKSSVIEKLCNRKNVRILVFQHGGNPLSMCLCMNNPTEAIVKLEKIFEEGMRIQENSEMVKNW